MIQNWLNKISNDEDAIYHKQIENFVNWCDKNYLYLNVSKTKEICIDFRKNQRCPEPVYIKGEAVERVDTYKYLGVVFDSKLNWKENINSVLKKVNSRMYCMRKLRPFPWQTPHSFQTCNRGLCQTHHTQLTFKNM